MQKILKINDITYTLSEYGSIVSDTENNELISKISDIITSYRNNTDIIIKRDEAFSINISLIKKWIEFNKNVFPDEKVKSVYVENTPSVVNSAAWLYAIEYADTILFGDKAEQADLALVSLDSLNKDTEKYKNYKYIITVGNVKVDFNEIKNCLDDTLWVNYYGFPYCFCISYAMETEVLGTKDVFHQIKPVLGFSVFTSNDSGDILPGNVIGDLSQKCDDIFLISPYRSVSLLNGKMYALGEKEGYINADGVPIRKSLIEKAVLESGMVNDCTVSGNTLFYSQSFSHSCFEIESALSDIGKTTLEFREVPYIPKNADGESDVQELFVLTDQVFSELDNINQKLKKDSSTDFYTYVDYENRSESVLSAVSEHNTDVLADDIRITDEPAFITVPSVDYRKCIYNNLSDIIKGSADSDQKIVYINPDGRETQTYKDLYNESLLFADGLRAKGIKAGDTVIFQIPDNHDYLVAFWGCILIGAISAPLGVLDDYGNNNLNTEKLYNIFKLIDNVHVLAADRIAESIRSLLGDDAVIKYSEIKGTLPHEELNHIWHDDDTCLMLFTSGSTGIPKGVELSQKNVFARTLGEIEMYGFDSSISDFNWMTLTHAAGLIWTHIRDTYLKAFQVQADTNTILKDPLSYFDYLTEFKSTTSWAPNFAYALISKSIDENKNYNWDLSHATNIYSTAEANVASTLRGFLKKTAKYGMRQTALIPAFGMTETSSVMIYYNNFSLDTTSDDDRFVPIGELAVGHSARITDDEGNILKKGQIGKIELKGDTVTCGYYKNPGANSESFTSDGYFITGDSGYIDGKNIVLTGRIKEMIIINGLNYYVQDIESIVDETEGVATSYTAALSVTNSSGTEDILIIFTPEKESLTGDEIRSLTTLIRNNVLEKSGLFAKYIVPDFKTNSLRTELGKKQRSKYRNNFYEGKYDPVLRETGVIKDNPYVMKQYIVRANNKCVSEKKDYSIIRDSLYDSDSRLFIDEFAVEHAEESSLIFLEKMYEHGVIWHGLPTDARIVIPCIGGKMISGNENFKALSSLLSGFIKSFNLENPNKRIILVDFDKYDRTLAESELFSVSENDEVFYRNGERYICEFRTITSDNRPSEPIDMFREKNVLIVGGTGGIGCILCKHIAEKYGASLLIVGRSDADENKLDDIRTKVSDNAVLCYEKADTSDYDQICYAAENFRNKTGRSIDVIINLAGAIDRPDGDSYWNSIDSHTIGKESFATFKYIIDSKLLTTMTLAKFAEDNDIRKFITFGSLNGILGGSGLSAYAAANSFQSRYTDFLNVSSGVDAYCINWCGWYGIGLSSETPDYIVDVSQTSGFRFTDAAENLSYFDSILKNDIRDCIVGIDRNNLQNRVFVNDKYSPVINIFYTGHDVDIKNMINSEKTSYPLNYLKTEMIPRNSGNNSDVNVSELRRCVINSNRTTTEMNDAEKKMADVWKEVLGCFEIDADSSFFELGGNSLLLTKLTYRISEVLNVNVSIQDIMLYKTVRKLVNHINNNKLDDRSDIIASKKKMLDEDINIEGVIGSDISSLKVASVDASVLIVGTFDIRCAFLIAELLKKYRDRKVYVMFDASDDKEALDKCYEMLEEYGLNEAIKNKNLNVFSADFKKANFGLLPKDYLKLCRDIGVVFHCGMDMNIISSYEALRNANIYGTKNILSFCCTEVRKKMIFISSVAVFRTVSGKVLPVCDEYADISTDMLDYSLNRDFHHSVYAADKIVQLAHNKGVDVKIIRCSRISGSSINGIINTDDIIWEFVRYMLEHGIAPQIDTLNEPMTPIDILAEQIVELSRIDEDWYIYHLKGTDINTTQIINWVRSIDQEIRAVSLDEWKDLISSSPEYNDARVTSMIGHFNNSEERESPANISDAFTRKVLRSHCITEFADTNYLSVLDITYNYLKRIGFITT